MSYSKGQERFTITDYFYDHDEMDIKTAYGYSHAESSLQGSTSAAATEAATTANASGASPNYRPVEKEQQGVLKLHELMPSPSNDVYLPSTHNRLSRYSSIPYSFSSQMQFDGSMVQYSSEEGMLQSPPTTSRSPGMQMHLSSRSQTTIDHHFGEGGNRESMATDISGKRVSTFQDKDRDRDWPVATPVARKRWWDGIFPSTLYTRLLLTVIIFETVVDLCIEGNILYRFNEEVKSNNSTEVELENKRRLPVYLIIFGLAHLWQFVLTIIAIRTKNTIQVFALTIFNFAFLGYAVIQIYELRKILGSNLADGFTGGAKTTLMTIPLNVLTAVIIAVIGASCLALLTLSVLLRREFGWQRYRFLGADLMIREYFFKFQVFECICYFGAFFCAGFGIQFIWLVLNPTDAEYIITWVAFPLLIIFLVIGRFAAKYENVYFMAAFMVGLWGGCAYFIFKLVRIWQRVSTTYANLEKSLTIFDIFSLVLLAACGVWGVMVWINFGKGLKQALLAKPRTKMFGGVLGFWSNGSEISEEKGQAMSIAQRRISID
ncbi:uncharacterized protein IAS62_000955 [Cryptococcus decagattii]|uniref:Uncharacterized protein n=1 Tax=Cryptococcus decagattii TaxID=1859122 RepID=A0ABZ2ASX6_9TREE